MSEASNVSGVKTPPGPLTGLLVLDLTHILNGPFGTMILSDMGARVIKVEQPGHGDDTRTYGPFVGDQSLYFDFVNRGKESIVLDLKNDADREVFLNIVRKADILTENYKPGTMKHLGFSYEELSAINPRLIFASSAGFGQTGPLAQYPAYDTIVQGMSGIMLDTGLPNDPPIRVGTSLSDLCGGIFMYAGIMTALHARETTGKGAHVDIAMFDATLSFLEHGFMAYVATGKAPPRLGNRHPSMAPFDVFQAADKPFVIATGNDHLFQQLSAAIGKPEMGTDSRYATNEKRVENYTALKAEMEDALQKQPAEHWLTVIHEAGVPVGPILTVAEAVEHPQTAARNMLIEAGGVHMPGNPIKISGYEDPKVRPAAPALDEHGARIRAEFGKS